MSNLAVLIPSRNPANLLACLSAVHRHEPEAWLVVIDDGIPWIQIHSALPPSLWNQLHIVKGPQPFCYARNCNLGIAEVPYTDVVLLNDDALLETPGGFSLMQQAAEEHPEYGIISATTNIVGNPAQRPQGVGLRYELRTLAFVCVFIPRRTIETVGLLDERFGGQLPDGRKIYGWEDNDLSRRVREAGLKLGIHDGCYVDHGSLHSTFRGDPRIAGDIGPGMELYRAKWGDLT